MTRQVQEQEIDLGMLWLGLKRRWPWILGSAVLLSLLAYVWSLRQPDVFEASSSLIAANTQNQPQDTVFGSSGVKAPPLPEGALAQALQSPQVIQGIVGAIKQSREIPLFEQDRLVTALKDELGNQRLRTLNLVARLDNVGNGIYTVRAKARTAASAQVLANIASGQLRAWDTGRALETIKRAQRGFKAQLEQIDGQVGQVADRIERETLIARRAAIQRDLAQVNILETSANGVLSKLSEAVEPKQPIAPKPLRNAVLGGVLGLLFSVGVSALLTLLDRTVRSEDDLLNFGLPTLGVIPRLRQRDTAMKGIVRAARQDGLYEALGFLRVNLLTMLQQKAHPVIVLSSTVPGEGKSSLTATLADGFAANGRKVLIIDADLRRGTQDVVWRKFNEQGQGQWKQLIGQGGVRTTREALQNPHHVQVWQTEELVHVLPAGQGFQDSLSVLNQVHIAEALSLWREHYDVILIDTAPLLAIADGLVLAAQADGLVMILEYGRTNLTAVRRALRRAEHAGINVLGFVINKFHGREDRAYQYGYGYSYTPKDLEVVR